MTILPDVNVWIAVAVPEHEHHKEATRWLQATEAHGIAFCRVTQMGFLRVLNNVHVMKNDHFTSAAAWHLFDRLVRDTDAKIIAFAEATGFTVVTSDRGMMRHGKICVRLLGREGSGTP